VSFASPVLLLGLLAAPLAVWGYLLLERRRAGRAARWSSPTLLPNMVDGDPGRRRHIPAVLFLLGLTLLLVGFARPEARLSQVREGATVVLAIDVSGSMGAKDVRPSRLGAAGATAVQFAHDLPHQYRIALVTFSNHAAVRLPPTYAHDEMAGALPVKPQEEATALGDGIDAALKVAQKAVGPNKPGSPHPPVAIVVLSDGNQNAGQRTPEVAAAEARKAGIPISTVSLGTPGGILFRPLAGGNTEQTAVPVQPKDLQAIAKATGGRFFAAQSAVELKQVYEDLGSRLLHEKKKREVTVAVTAVALVLILAGALLSGVWFRRLV
jgi:Ca-activated chloride channel family protein